jgi:hypothetical protein
VSPVFAGIRAVLVEAGNLDLAMVRPARLMADAG